MPKSLGLGDVGRLERKRVDAVLARNFARDFFRRTRKGMGIVMQRIVQIEQDDLKISFHSLEPYPKVARSERIHM